MESLPSLPQKGIQQWLQPVAINASLARLRVAAASLFPLMLFLSQVTTLVALSS